MPVLAERENRIPQPARVHLNQSPELTHRLTSQQLHMPKEGKGAQGMGSGVLLRCRQGHFNLPELRFLILIRKIAVRSN